MNSDGSILMRVEKCSRCGGDHEEPLRFFRLERQTDAWSHWATCPTTREPIMLKTMGGSFPTETAVMIPPREGVNTLPAPSLSVLDVIAEETKWDRKGLLSDHVLRLIRRHNVDYLGCLYRALHGESLRLRAEGIQNNLEELLRSLSQYAKGVEDVVG